MDYFTNTNQQFEISHYNKPHLIQTQVCEPELILWAVLTLATFICYLSSLTYGISK